MAAPALDAVDPLDAEIDRFEAFACGLVRLEPHALEELRAEVERLAAAVSAHLRAGPGGRSARAAGRRRPGARRQRLTAEHERFRTSIAELGALLAVVEGDDHGGHRQALGQYGRLLTEALRLHRGEERQLMRRDRARAPPSNHN